MTNELKRYLKNKKNLEDAFLYNPGHEHDSCGVGFVASTDGKQRRDVVQGGIDASRLYGIEVPLMLTERLVTEQAYLLRYLIIFLTMR